MAQPTSPTQSGSNDKDVTVTFTAPDSWSFSSDEVTMDGPGIVRLTRAAGATWTFVRAQITDPHAQFHPSVPSPNTTCVIRDDWKVKGSYKYVVTVKDGGREYTSPDPVIINSGP
jgi:hypothetical protein